MAVHMNQAAATSHWSSAPHAPLIAANKPARRKPAAARNEQVRIRVAAPGSEGPIGAREMLDQVSACLESGNRDFELQFDNQEEIGLDQLKLICWMVTALRQRGGMAPSAALPQGQELATLLGHAGLRLQPVSIPLGN